VNAKVKLYPNKHLKDALLLCGTSPGRVISNVFIAIMTAAPAKLVMNYQQARQKPSWMTLRSSKCRRCCSPAVNRVSYVGISLDGIGQVNDEFRGVAGAFDRAVQGIRNCQDAGVRTGLRLTLTKRNVQDLEALFDFFEAENIERACFYHFVPSGRGKAIGDDDLSHAQSRDAIETILAKTKLYKQAGRKTDILTVDNHVDGVYLYLKLLKEAPSRAANVWKLLLWNGGGMYSSGVGIGCVDFNGKVHPNQFWGHYDLGDLHERPFSEIWLDPKEPLLKGLRNRREHIKGRCRLCRFFEACGGSLRVRADLYFGDLWAPDPGCYLTDDQIGLDAEKQAELVRSGEIFRMPD